MKRSVFITISIVLVLVLLSVWVYVLFFNQPADEDQFGNLEVNNPVDTTPQTQPVSNNPPVTVNVGGEKRLLQLTTVPTAGYQEITVDASSTPHLYYVEAGTGHIKSIDLASGEEQEISATTVSTAHQAALTPNGAYVMIQSGVGHASQLTVGTINHESHTLDTEVIPGQVVTFTATEDNTFLYAIKDTYTVTGYEYNPEQATTKTRFTVPFREAMVVWGGEENTPYVYPKVSGSLEGYLYQITSNQLHRTPISAYGLTAVGTNNTILYSYTANEKYVSSLYHKTTNTTSDLAYTLIPEKCDTLVTETESFICGQAITTYGNTLPDAWYQGAVSFKDQLWELDPETGEMRLLMNISKESGRDIDVNNLNVTPEGKNVYFINKNDRTLWLYRRLLESE